MVASAGRRRYATPAWADDHRVLCCRADLVLPAERTAERQPDQRGTALLVSCASAPHLSPARRCPRSRTHSPVPRSAAACGCRAVCLWTTVVSPSRSSKAARSSHSETVSLNARDLQVVAAFLSCPGNRSDHAHGVMRPGLALATAGPLGGFFGQTVRQDLCHASDGET